MFLNIRPCSQAPRRRPLPSGQNVEEEAQAARRRHPQVGRAAPTGRVRICTYRNIHQPNEPIKLGKKHRRRFGSLFFFLRIQARNSDRVLTVTEDEDGPRTARRSRGSSGSGTPGLVEEGEVAVRFVGAAEEVGEESPATRRTSPPRTPLPHPRAPALRPPPPHDGHGCRSLRGRGISGLEELGEAPACSSLRRWRRRPQASVQLTETPTFCLRELFFPD